jgi:hypothetical protein
MLRRVLLAVLLFGALDVSARDRAVVVYPRESALFRSIFYTPHQRLLIATLKQTFEVDVREQVATDEALFDIDVTGAKLLVLSGHGDPFAMYFAGRDSRTLDSTDRARLAAFLATLAPDATIVLQSCYAGRGFAHLVKDVAGGRRVIAAKGEIPRDGLAITSLQPFDITITCQDGGDHQSAWDCTIRL